jgi:RNA polymerase sigma factor (sigma-70 family)
LQSLSSILHQVRSYRGLAETTAVSDAELLRRFQSRGDEAAFELLVWRHGPMVLGVCRRIVRDPHLAEDAFQATFLTLARKAGSIGVRDAIAGWLYTVAQRIALAARARRDREQTYMSAPMADANEPSYWPTDKSADSEERELLRAEVDRLPQAFRTVIVMCCLEGRSRTEAAEQLGVPVGTVESRLVRARERLRRGLAARGLVMAVGTFTSFLSDNAGALIKVSPVLVHSTMHLVLLLKFGSLAAAGAAVELMEEAGSRSAAAFYVAAGTGFVAAVALVTSAVMMAMPQPQPPTRSVLIAPPMRPMPMGPIMSSQSPEAKVVPPATVQGCHH